MKGDFVVEIFGERKICIAGIGKLFYQQGFPISMSISHLHKKGIEVSIFHVADECIKNGWSGKTTFNKLKSDFEDDIDKNITDHLLRQLQSFCYASYTTQREIIFQYLYSTSSVEILSYKVKRSAFIQQYLSNITDTTK